MRAPVVHNVRANHRDWTPPTVIYADTETVTIAAHCLSCGAEPPNNDPQCPRCSGAIAPELLRLRLWAATMEDRRDIGKKPREVINGSGDTAEQFANWIESVFVGRQTIWLYCHNLSFDLATTRLPLVLSGRGWEITDSAVSGRSPWMRLAKGDKRLCLVDSWSWLPQALEAIGAKVGIPKLTLPGNDDTRQAWLARCKGDVAILRAAIGQLMDWWERNQLGNWTISGAGCGWNAYRHIPTRYPVTIIPTAEGQAEDRRYIYGGRRGTWRVGHLRAGPFLEIDFVAAYPTIARHCALPTKRMYPFDHLRPDASLLDSQWFDVAARCRLRTDVPRWPVRKGGRVWYPVGEFWADLTGPEIREARALGCLVEIGPGRVHRVGYAMEPWAEWILAVQNGDVEDAPPVARLAAKTWGRSVIGKWASRSYETVKLGDSPESGWSYVEGWDQASNQRGGEVHIAGQAWWHSALPVADNGYPAVLAWVEAEVRVRLSRAIEAIGPGAVVQCDTDGMIVAERTIGTTAAKGSLVAPDGLNGPARAQWTIDALNSLLTPLQARIKRVAPHVQILGPQHTRFGAERRYSGIPGLAPEVQPDTFRVTTWPKLQWQMTHGDTAGYVRPTVSRHIRGPYATGWILTDKSVAPVQADIDQNGATVFRGWARTEPKPRCQTIENGQHPYLDSLW